MPKSETDKALTITAVTVGLPGAILSVPSQFNHSTPGHNNPFRSMDVLGIPNFFDHAGNFANGLAISVATLMCATALEAKAGEDKKQKIIIGSSLASSALATGTNVAYEAGVEIPPFEKKPDDAPFDAQDALYGSAAGILFSAVFCCAALYRIRRNKS